jgi:hypothetical protein
MENGDFCFFAANEKWKWQTFHLFGANNGKWNFVYFGQQMINGNRQLLFQQTCPFMVKSGFSSLLYAELVKLLKR